ncbi:MAG: hypothetical protein H7X92_09535 [Chitinophagales bacterium]|nr:hypothetical protein [Hyphomicrobiales bacterium]
MLRFMLPLACLAMFQSPVAADDLQTVLKGKAVASRASASCHSIEPRGDSPVTDATPFRELVSTFSGEDVEDSVKSGLTLSHQVKLGARLTADDADALIAFLRWLATEAAGE